MGQGLSLILSIEICFDFIKKYLCTCLPWVKFRSKLSAHSVAGIALDTKDTEINQTELLGLTWNCGFKILIKIWSHFESLSYIFPDMGREPQTVCHLLLRIYKVLPPLLFLSILTADPACTTSWDQRHFSVSTGQLQPGFLRVPKSYLLKKTI